MTKKHLRYLCTLLLCMMASVGWANEVTVTWTASAATNFGGKISTANSSNTGTIKTGDFEWSYTNTLTYLKSNKQDYQSMTNGFIQIGSGNAYHSLSLSTSSIPGTIKSVSVDCSSANANHKLTITVGNTPYIQGEATASGAPTESGEYTLTGTGTSSGEITISFVPGNGALYIRNISVTYENGGSTPDLENSDLALTGEHVALTFDLYNNSAAQTINYTTSSTGAITVSASDYVTTSVDENNKTITVTPTAVTPSAQTITVSQDADDTYLAGSATFTVTISNNDPDRLGGANNPYTVAQALENTPASGNSEDVYVKGIVSKFQAADIMSDGTNYRYYISDDGTTNNQLLVYKGKGLNNVAFSNADDLQIGDVVVVKGQLYTYNNTKEIYSDNYIVSLKRKTTPTLSFGENAYSVVKNGTLTISATSNSTGAITYESSNTDVAEIDATSGVVTAKAAGTCTITATIATTDDYKSITATVELTVTAPKHKVTFYQNGTKLSEEEVAEDAAITLPEAEAEINGKAFVGWIASTIEGETNDAPAFVTTATMGTSDVNYYAVYATKEGEATSTTASLTEEEIKDNFTKEKMSYGTAKTFVDDKVTWTANAYTDMLNRPWIQLKKDATAYLKINTNDNISEVKLTITSATNSSGGIIDITKHTAFSGNVYLESAASSNPKGALGSSNSISNNVVTLIPTSDVKEVYIQVSTGARIWGAEVTYVTPAPCSAYCTTVLPPIELAKPIIFHDGGTYEQALKVAIAGQGTIKYKLNGGAEQTYSTPIDVNETTTITAWVEQDGSKSDEISKTFTIETKEAGPSIEDGYYTIKNNGNGKYVNVAGRRTVTFVDEAATAAAPGTVIKVKATGGQLEVLRSQGVDLPAYAEKAMNYVPQIVQLVVDKLHIEGSGELLGENGLKALMKKFDESFDYHLYLEKAGDYYRIYGRTPSMQPVVDFYAENKDNVDAKLPGLEEFINSAIQKILNKTNGSGASILVPFSLETVWENMGGTLTNPAENQAKFYEEVLSSEANVWNFAYQTAMLYWGNLKSHPRFDEVKDKLGDLAKYIDKIENIQPNSKYYIVQQNGQMDIINQSNSVFISDIAAEADFTAWTIKDRTEFKIAIPEDNMLNGKYYTTLYTDFAYTLPEGMKAYKVTSINPKTGVAARAIIAGTIPAQTPVLLESESAEAQTLTLDGKDTSAAPTDNVLVGPDYLINEYKIKTAQIEGLFDFAKEILGEDAYNNYVAEYEHLMYRNSGTVNNKYFFGLDATDLKGVENLRMLGLDNAGENLAFHDIWTTVAANQAFIVDSHNPVKIWLKGDVNRDGDVNVIDVTAVVDIIITPGITPEKAPQYDFDAADAYEDGEIEIKDVITIVNIFK